MNILTKYLSCLCKFAFIALAIGAFSLTAYASAEDTGSSIQINSASLDLSLQSSEHEASQSLLPAASPCGQELVSSTDYQQDQFDARMCCDDDGACSICKYEPIKTGAT